VDIKSDFMGDFLIIEVNKRRATLDLAPEMREKIVSEINHGNGKIIINLSYVEFIDIVRDEKVGQPTSDYNEPTSEHCSYLDRIAKKNRKVFMTYLAAEIAARSYLEFESLCDKLGEIDSDTRDTQLTGDIWIDLERKNRMKKLVKTPFSLYWSRMEHDLLCFSNPFVNFNFDSPTKEQELLHKMYAENETQTMQEFVEGIENHIYEVKRQLSEEEKREEEKKNTKWRGVYRGG